MLRICCRGVALKRVMVNFTDRQWELLEKLRGILGNSDSEIVRNIVLMFLSEKGYLKAEGESED